MVDALIGKKSTSANKLALVGVVAEGLRVLKHAGLVHPVVGLRNQSYSMNYAGPAQARRLLRSAQSVRSWARSQAERPTPSIRAHPPSASTARARPSRIRSSPYSNEFPKV